MRKKCLDIFGGKRANALVLSMLSVMVTGCATHLHVWDGENSELLKGIPVKVGELFVKRGQYTKLSKDTSSPCWPQDIYEVVMLPTGSTYYVNVDSDWLAKAEFAVSYHDNGRLAGVSMNSDVAGGVKAATESLTQLLPFAGLLPAERAEAESRVAGEAARATQNSGERQDNGETTSEETPAAPVPLCDGAPAALKFVPLSNFLEKEGG